MIIYSTVASAASVPTGLYNPFYDTRAHIVRVKSIVMHVFDYDN